MTRQAKHDEARRLWAQHVGALIDKTAEPLALDEDAAKMIADHIRKIVGEELSREAKAVRYGDRDAEDDA